MLGQNFKLITIEGIEKKKKWGRGCGMVLGLNSFSRVSWLEVIASMLCRVKVYLG